MRISLPMVRLMVPALALLTGGCASVVHGSKQNIAVNTTPGGAQVQIHDEHKNREVVFSGTTPCTVSLNRGAGFFKGAKYHVVITKAGCMPFEMALSSHVSGWYFGNLGIGGILGFLIVDPATGGMFSLDPREISADLRTKHVSFLHREKEGIRVVLQSEVPTELAGYLKPIKG